MDDAVVAQPAEVAEDEAGRAEAGEDGLDEIGAGEGGEEQPPGADAPSEDGAKENDGTGEEADEGFGLHVGS